MNMRVNEYIKVQYLYWYTPGIFKMLRISVCYVSDSHALTGTQNQAVRISLHTQIYSMHCYSTHVRPYRLDYV